MYFMNRCDVESACERYAGHPVLAPATRFLFDFMMEVDAHSDGWPHWQRPQCAIQSLIELIRNPHTATMEAFIRSLKPVKAFYTRHGFSAGMSMPQLPSGTPQPASPESRAATAIAHSEAQLVADTAEQIALF